MADMGDFWREIKQKTRARKDFAERTALEFLTAWCSENNCELKIIQDYQFRLTKEYTVIDIFPQSFKYHDITFNQRGAFSDLFDFLENSIGKPKYLTIKLGNKCYYLQTEDAFIISPIIDGNPQTLIVTPMRVPKDRAGHEIRFMSGEIRYINYSKTGPWVFYNQKPEEHDLAQTIGKAIMEHGTP